MRTLSVILAALSLGGIATSAQAATNISYSGLGGAEYDTAGVYIFGDVNFTGATDDGGGLDSILFEIWDDYTLKFSDIYSLAVGTSGSFHFDTSWPGLVGTSAPGLGLYVTDNGEYQYDGGVIDPYYLAHYADPAQCETDCGPQGAVPEPSTWAMLLLGFGMTGGAFRLSRRKKVSYSAA